MVFGDVTQYVVSAGFLKVRETVFRAWMRLSRSISRLTSGETSPAPTSLQKRFYPAKPPFPEAKVTEVDSATGEVGGPAP